VVSGTNLQRECTGIDQPSLAIELSVLPVLSFAEFCQAVVARNSDLMTTKKMKHAMRKRRNDQEKSA
jgi:hypothetical protein